MKRVTMTILSAVLLIALLFVGPIPQAADVQAAPKFQMPFPCGQKWQGSTRKNHSPKLAVDFSRSGAKGKAVVASAGGTVEVVEDLKRKSYGKYVVINHGGGWKTYYAHLNSFSVKKGQKVSMGTKIGTVGSTGNSTGPHLHYEQRYKGKLQYIKLNGKKITYYGKKTYTSKNKCGSGGGGKKPITGTVKTSGKNLIVRSGPGTKYKAVGTLKNGQKVTITCQTKGSKVKGTYGTSTLWNKVGKGYVSDAYVYTGSNKQIAPTCKK